MLSPVVMSVPVALAALVTLTLAAVLLRRAETVPPRPAWTPPPPAPQVGRHRLESKATPYRPTAYADTRELAAIQ